MFHILKNRYFKLFENSTKSNRKVKFRFHFCFAPKITNYIRRIRNIKKFTQKQVKELIELFEKLHKQFCSNIQEIDSHKHNSVNICLRLVSNEFVSLMEKDLIGCIQRTQISGENKYWNTFLQFYQTQQRIPIRERLNEMLKTISAQIMATEELVKLKAESFLWTLHRKL